MENINNMNDLICGHLRIQVTTAISQLQALELEMAEDGFEIETPDDYSTYARIFIRENLKAVHDVLGDYSEKLGKEAEAETQS